MAIRVGAWGHVRGLVGTGPRKKWMKKGRWRADLWKNKEEDGLVM